jgi:molecular chaperone DnaK
VSVVGLDLGTTNTVVAAVRSGKVQVLADENGARLLPSVVSFHPNGDVLVGAGAKARRTIDPKNTIVSHKRLIGRSWSSQELTAARSKTPFELREGPGQGPLVHVRGQDYTLPEISAFVLKRARQIAETALGTQVDRAVITVPAHFNELQRASTKVAGRVAGIEVMRILNEPTAAALAYGLGRTGAERVAVYDFGGGTFDCTLLDLNGNVFEVLATAGDSFLGGDDVDELIAIRMAEQVLKQHRYDARTDPVAFEKLKAAAEKVKFELSTKDTGTVRLQDVGFGAGGKPIDMTFQLPRRDFDAMLTPLVERSFKVTQDALALARLTPSSFDKIILVGGSTRMPLVRARVEAFFGTKPLDRVNPDEVVAIGAAIQAAALTDNKRKRDIPAPPVPMPPSSGRTLGSPEESTQTAAFAMPPGSQVPTARTGPPPIASGPPAHASPVRTASGPPNLAAPKAAPSAPGPPFKNTRPMGQVQEIAAKGRDGRRDKEESFPDLQPPAPFEWFPEEDPDGGTATFTLQAPESDGGTMTQMRAHPGDVGAHTEAGFGAIDEPPSLYSTPDARLPGNFGQLQDLSLVSTTGVQGAQPPMSAVPETRALPGAPPLPPPAPGAGRKRKDSYPSMNSFGSFPSMAERTSPLPQGAPGQQPGQPAVPPPHGPSGMPPAIGLRGQHFPSQPPPARPPSGNPGAPYPMSPSAAPPGGSRPPLQDSALFGSNPPLPMGPMASAPPPAQPFFQQQTAPMPLQQPSYGPPFGGSMPPQPQGPAGGPSYPPGRPSDAPLLAGVFPSAMPSMPVQGGRPLSLSPEPGAPILVDVTPRGLVVETAGGYADTIIPRNAKIPCERTRKFATGRDNQTVVKVRVAQGEHPMFAGNTYLGEVDLSGIRPATRGEVTVLVTFELDSDGTMRVRARDATTGHEAVATIQLVGVADESSVVMMINRFAQQPILPGSMDPRS